ncbi:MAG TPA: ATP-binding protein [Albitalea sp.]|uniref:ATP-binding response regulator n=1 Tax=Piscinibacter sp. TaxID=1903157 RepID=UPI002ECFED80
MTRDSEDTDTRDKRPRAPSRGSGSGPASRRSPPRRLVEAHFQRFAESSDDVFWLADLTAGELLYVSPRFEQLWGVQAKDLLQDPSQWNRAVLPADAAALPQPFFADQAQSGETVREYRIRAPGGETRWIRDRRFHLRDDGGRTLRVGGIAEDVTERKTRELENVELLDREREARAQAEAGAQAKDEFLAVVTHELRSPLNAIRGWAHVMRHAGVALNATQVKALDAIDRNTQAQAQLVDDLLDSQRILCGKLELEMQRLPLAELLDDAVMAVRPAAEQKRIRLELSHDPRIGIVRADPDRLRQALVKLVSNAVKFTPEDGIVSVRSERRPGALAIEVKDTGIGLEPSQLPYVFDRFQQVDSSRTRRASGLGLGLSLAQQLVELHGGRIGVDSAGPGQGTTFTVELGERLLQPSEAPAVAPDIGSPLAGKRILVVEDDADAREVLSLILRSADAQLHSFDCAAAAFDYLEHVAPEERPDALISDIAMPDEDGYAFIRRVRKMEDGEHRPHVVALALTAFSRVEDRVRALKAGFDAHVAKPIDPDRVVNTLVRTLGAGDGRRGLQPAGTP